MLDDLDLAWEEQQEPRRRGAPQTRQARQRRRKERKRRRRSFGALFISFLLLAALGGGVYFGVGKLQELFGAPDFTGNPAKVAVNVTVEPGDAAPQIGEELYEKGVVKSVRAFVKAADANPDHTKIQPGTYQLYKETQASVALEQLLDPDKYMVQDRVTIREGLTAIQTFKELAKATGIPEKEFTDAAKDPIELGVPDWWFGGDRADGKKNRRSIEGFLFPDTYAFAPEETATDILKKMVGRFNDVAGEIKFADTVQSGLGITPYEALIVASLAQVEAGKEEDFAKISRVAYNRAIKFKDSFPCGCLQFDVTANYFLEQSGKKTKASKDMTAAELDNPRNPWNTGPSTPGLPVGPISNPGKAAMEGAMSPAKGNWLYFVAVDKNGTTKFANTKDEHDNNVLEACRNGVLTCNG
jgi:UPF0755 protein